MKNGLFLLLNVVVINVCAQSPSYREVRLKEKATLLARSQKEAEAKSASQNFVRKYALLKERVACGNCSAFVPQPGAIRSFDQQTMIIDTPGYYFFLEDVKWNPNHCPNNAAIVIQADNVTLDLNGYSLIALGADSNRQFTGIKVSAANHVTIKNGTVSGMTYNGITTEASSILTIDMLTISAMNYSDTAAGAMPAGIRISHADSFIVRNSKVVGMNVTSASCVGVWIDDFSSRGHLYNDTVAHLRNNDGGVQGFSCFLSSGIRFNQCHSFDFQSHYVGRTNTEGHSVLGFMPVGCVDLSYDSCSAVGMVGCCDDAHGMSLFFDAGVEVNHFIARNITDGVTSTHTGAKATGIEVYGAGILIQNCLVDSISAIVPQDLQCAGFSACGYGIKFENCTAKNVSVLNAQLIPDTTKGFGTGFGWAPDPRDTLRNLTADTVVYSNCTAVNCQLGFDSWNHTNSVWNNWQALNCGRSVSQQSQTATRTLSMNKCSEAPNGIPFSTTITNKAVNNRFDPPLLSKRTKK